ncbi:MAG: agmatine deiminase family protein, partial [Tannerellaceae bacterium]|nr:agmatine deiminase family protein [Tannerellaceae bacterium]
HDNLITRKLFESGVFEEGVSRVSFAPVVLEGGSIDSDGAGTIMTTVSCLTSVNRNDHLNKDGMEAVLKSALGAVRVLWLNHGMLVGDDTGGHIDTLARFCGEDTIAYVRCYDPYDEHYAGLIEMEREISSFRRRNGRPYRLIPLPLPPRIEWKGERLPATYANFLIINEAVLMPSYGTDTDGTALDALSKAFPDRKVIAIDCRPLIRQHGSLHCVTMQYPLNFI